MCKMLIYRQNKYLNCLMPYIHVMKQHGFVNEMHSIGNENCEHICSRIPNCPTSDSTIKLAH